MDINVDTLYQMITPGLIIIASIGLGFLAQWFVIHKLSPVVGKTRWTGDDIIIKSLKGALVIWFLIAGIYIALPMVPIHDKFTSILQKMAFVILLISVTVVLANMGGGLIKLFLNNRQPVLFSTSIINNVVKGIILVIGGLIILSSLGISITPLITALGIGGLAVALALQEPLGNLFSGKRLICNRHLV